MTNLPEIGDVVFREKNGQWEVFVDTDGDRSIRAATGTAAIGVIMRCDPCQLGRHQFCLLVTTGEDCNCGCQGYPDEAQ